jgi:hypothetical protein
MRRNLFTVIVTVVFLGCGGSSPGPVPVGFVNQTQHSDADLRAIWRAAQQSVASEIDLNPLQRISSNKPPDLRPGDPRALHAMPHQLAVTLKGMSRPKSFSPPPESGAPTRQA